MRRELFIFLLVVFLGILPAGCDQAEAIITPTPGPEAGEATPQEVLTARRVVLDFLREGANECVPPKGVTWEKKPGVAPDDFEVIRFDSEGCLMTVSYPLPVTADTIYHVTLHNNVTGFCWQANVDAEGSITTTGTEAGMLPELSNAAAAYCTEQGYTYEVQEQKDGQQCGVCVFNDKENCNAWAYLQGICSP